MPRHVAVVMDGNGRWANQRGLPRTKGHEAGEAALLDVVAGRHRGRRHPPVGLRLLHRELEAQPRRGASFLMGFNRDVIRRRRDQLHEWGVRMRWVGRRPRLWGSVIKELEVAQELTRRNTGLTLYFCVNYGGRAEIGDAVQRLAEDVARGRLKPRSVDEHTVARYLPEPDMPDVDLFVRSLGGAAHEQLPALAERLRRDGLPGPALARLRPARPVGRRSSPTSTASAATAAPSTPRPPSARAGRAFPAKAWPPASMTSLHPCGRGRRAVGRVEEAAHRLDDRRERLVLGEPGQPGRAGTPSGTNPLPRKGRKQQEHRQVARRLDALADQAEGDRQPGERERGQREHAGGREPLDRVGRRAGTR